TKFWAIGKFSAPPAGEFSTLDPPMMIVEGLLNFTRVHNQGVAFGFGNGTAWAPVVFLMMPLIALILIRIFWTKGVFANLLSKIAIALLLCGIFGNLTDRLVQGFLLESYQSAPFWQRLAKGYVVDFIDVTIPIIHYRWPCFNVADSCVCIAAFLLFIGGIRDEQLAKKKKA
ncbi:MAG: signal peptidase II, partial [Akkermansiaceae bacterium]|nr:signal peptidase II [Akkermansiaceae bacterium]